MHLSVYFLTGIVHPKNLIQSQFNDVKENQAKCQYLKNISEVSLQASVESYSYTTEEAAACL